MEAQPGIDAFLQRIKSLVGDERYSVWFEGVVTVSVEGSTAVLTTPTTFHRERLCSQFREFVASAARETFGSDSVDYRCAEQTSEPAPRRLSKRRALKTTEHATREPSAPTSDSLDGWIANTAAAEAETTCRRIVTGQLHASPVVLWGKPGVGKTHLLRAISEAVRADKRRRRVLMINAEQFIVGFVAAIRGAGLPSFRQKHRGADLLLLDNAHQLVGKQRTTEEFLSTLDHVAAAGGQVVLTSDRSPAELAEMGPELASRFAGGIAVPVQMPDTPCRATLIEQAANERGIQLCTAARDALAVSLSGGAREVSGAMNRLAIMHEAFGLEIDDELARRVAAEINQLSAPRVGIRQIESAVCDVFGIGSKDLRSSKRTKAVTEPRMLAMWLSRKLTGSAWSEIGDHFGRRSHSTVISAHRRVERLLAKGESPRLCGQAGDLNEAIRRVETALRIA